MAEIRQGPFSFCNKHSKNQKTLNFPHQLNFGKQFFTTHTLIHTRLTETSFVLYRHTNCKLSVERVGIISPLDTVFLYREDDSGVNAGI